MEVNLFEKVEKVLSINLCIVCFSFCMLAIAVLYYYIRKRYRLYREIRGISREQLWYTCYQCHLKNLKVKSMIANFVIVIIFMEIINNGTIVFDLILQLLNGKEGWVLKDHVRFISKYCFIPMLCMFLDVLWLAYLHSQYKYTIMRWTAYIILRIIAINIFYKLFDVSYFPRFALDQEIYRLIDRTLLMVFDLIDFFSYLWYSRRFYKHLKGRELEAKLFKSRKKYYQNKYVCRHFKISTLLVAASLAIYIIPNVFYPFAVMFQFNQREHKAQDLVLWPFTSCQLLYRVLFNFNYLYLIVVNAYRYWRQKRSLTRVNDRIQPLVRKYQQQIYGRYYKDY